MPALAHQTRIFQCNSGLCCDRVHEALLVTGVGVGGRGVAAGAAGLHAALIHTAVMQVSWTMRIMILTYVVPCALQNSIDCTDLQAFFMGN